MVSNHAFLAVHLLLVLKFIVWDGQHTLVFIFLQIHRSVLRSENWLIFGCWRATMLLLARWRHLFVKLDDRFIKILVRLSVDILDICDDLLWLDLKVADGQHLFLGWKVIDDPVVFWWEILGHALRRVREDVSAGDLLGGQILSVVPMVKHGFPTESLSVRSCLVECWKSCCMSRWSCLVLYFHYLLTLISLRPLTVLLRFMARCIA